jgi:phospholipid/cholesterol/gamma-HCH transport system ATP-binding protein
MSPAASELEWRGVRKVLGGRSVLDGLDLSLAAGRSLVIIGGSGQGKSVTMKLALGLMRPDAGTVLFRGQPLPGLFNKRQSDLYRQAGVLFQGSALFDSLKVWEVVSFRLLHAEGRPRRRAREAAIEALAQVQLGPEVAELFPSELSGGMQKRVGLARAIVGRPRILFFDEPTTGLDPVTAATINRLIADQVKRLGSTAVTITHDLVSARTIADEIALLESGRIAWRGGRTDFDATDDPRVRSMIEASRPPR